MARSATIGNGNILVGIDAQGSVRDFYFPFVGHANHISGASGVFGHRVGVWVDGAFSWLTEDLWAVDVGVEEKSMNTDIHARNETLGITLHFKDVVHNEVNIFLRTVTVTNDVDASRTIKVFFAQEFRISESRRGDTGFYDPRVQSVIHYKGHNIFLIHGEINGRSFTDYSIGIFDIEGKDGTFRDAEDGILSRNSVEHGSVDSVIGLTFEATPKASAAINYWITVASTVPKAHELHCYVKAERPERILSSVQNYWRIWIEKDKRNFAPLGNTTEALYHRSLQIMRVHADNRGGIIASSDSDMLNHGRDHYSYVWPRDSVVVADALSRAGHHEVAKRLFAFLSKLIEPDGYLMHKYRVDGVLGSSWHPWMRNGKPELPIQEDETASVIFFLLKFYERTKDIEFIESLYNTFIEPASEFLISYIDSATGLPEGSYDLWEEKWGTSTYTAASVYGGLMAAATFSELLGKTKNRDAYQKTAARIKAGIETVLFQKDLGGFIKLVHLDGSSKFDTTLDSSSFFGPILFGVFTIDDPRIVAFKQTVDTRLRVGEATSHGYVRYERDAYYTAADTGTPNPWIVCTMWMAQYDIMCAESVAELASVEHYFRWVEAAATQSGILAEQIHPQTKAPLSTAPLVWSHAEYVITVDMYLKKYASLT